jgi:hypothetical protein
MTAIPSPASNPAEWLPMSVTPPAEEDLDETDEAVRLGGLGDGRGEFARFEGALAACSLWTCTACPVSPRSS